MFCYLNLEDKLMEFDEDFEEDEEDEEDENFE